ncbi:MAG: hypothetical protein AAGF27_01250 [Pseudomonadota bacterium]
MSDFSEQLGFGTFLQDAETDNATRVFDRETAHLLAAWAEALAYHCRQIEDHHAAMLANDFEAAKVIRKEAHLLAKKLNGGQLSILASDHAPGCRLEACVRSACWTKLMDPGVPR